ncbi:unnamed protein product [Macrosiphum euphorbiae]|uniref:HAT C-terminal dimerisation domain-containing protein n=1 Tax=Macrosiphum euphorbiae TaxID=13131 RepID=A0AAV0YBV0_9HEMI|nr:unnamed protein product [Macrosiphum euphorbiae]
MEMAIDSFTKLNFDESSFFIDNYKKLCNVDVVTFKSEMLVAKNCIVRLNKHEDVELEDLKKLLLDKSVNANLYSLLQVALSIPVSSATCERSFSAMRRTKTWTSMHQERFTNLSLIHIERDISNTISTENILDEFSKKDRRFSF